MKRILTLLLALVLLVSLALPISAAQTQYAVQYGACAYSLWSDGLFLGTGTTFDLDQPLTRAAGVTMMVRLLGKDAEAKAGTFTTPFTDLPDWALGYVGYAYENGLTKGTGQTTFSPDDTMTATQFLTLVLRALGYDDAAGDFSWDHAQEKAVEIGLVNGGEFDAAFLRDQAAYVCWRAVGTCFKDSETLLEESLPPAVRPEGTPPTPTAGEPPEDEFARAQWNYFTSAAHAGKDPDSITISWLQYCKMLSTMLEAYDPACLPQWEEWISDAPWDAKINRDGAMVTLLYAAKAMDVVAFNADPSEAFEGYAGTVWEMVTMDYPIFDWDTPIEIDEGCSDNNHVGPSYDFSQRRVSLTTGLPLLEFDDTGDLRLEQPLTLREAAVSILRLYESSEQVVPPEDRIVLEQPEGEPPAEPQPEELPEELPPEPQSGEEPAQQPAEPQPGEQPGMAQPGQAAPEPPPEGQPDSPPAQPAEPIED